MGKKIFRLVLILLLIWGAFWYGKNRNQYQPLDTENQVEQGSEKQYPDTDIKAEATEGIIGFGQKNDGKKISSPLRRNNTTSNMLPAIFVPKKIETAQLKSFDSDVKTEITVYFYEWGIDVSNKIFSSGDVTFTAINNGQFSHNFVVDGVKDFGKILPGETKVFEPVFISHGSFNLFSDKSIDIKNGMTERVNVE